MKNFKTINGFDNYLINTNGDVYNTKTKKFLKPIKKPRGYYHYVLYKNNKPYSKSRHRLVLETFNSIPNMKEMTVDHIDGKPGNDHISNLRWLTIKDNIKMFYKTSKRKKDTKEIIIYDTLSGEIKEYKNYRELAKIKNVTPDTILYRLAQGVNYLHIDFCFYKYKEDLTEFPKINDPFEYRKYYSKKKSYIGKNYITDEVKTFESLTEISKTLNMKLPFLSLRISDETIFPNGWSFKQNLNFVTFKKLDFISVLEKIDTFDKRKKVILVLEDKIHVFYTAKAVSEYYNIQLSSLDYKLKHNDNKFIYFYNFKTKSILNNRDVVAIHLNTL